jgi:hypothetical protein
MRPKRIIGDGVMRKWNQAALDAAEAAARAERNRKQDDDFCRALRTALWAGKESCPVGVSTEPGTKKPVLHYHRPD